MDEIEQKEREEQAEGPKAVKDKKLKGKTGGGRLKILAAETMPSPVGRRVAPKVSEDDRKKVERLDQAARNTKDGIKKERKKVKYMTKKVLPKHQGCQCQNVYKLCFYSIEKRNQQRR